MTNEKLPILFYRVGNERTKQGLWYDYQGNFTGLIHDTYTFCTNTKLPMPFDEQFVGYLSATKTLDELWIWFPVEDIKLLRNFGFSIALYEATDYKFLNGHWLISQESSKFIGFIISEQEDFDDHFLSMEHYYVITGNEMGVNIESKHNFFTIDEAETYFDIVKDIDFAATIMHVNNIGKETEIKTYFSDITDDNGF